jgi:hypothetical protein
LSNTQTKRKGNEYPTLNKWGSFCLNITMPFTMRLTRPDKGVFYLHHVEVLSNGEGMFFWTSRIQNALRLEREQMANLTNAIYPQLSRWKRDHQYEVQEIKALPHEIQFYLQL